jgi:hypothetical protein
MADQHDVRRIAVSLPETIEEEIRFAFSVLNRNLALYSISTPVATRNRDAML